MAGKIPRHFIDELLARTDIINVIDEFVPLKKAGKDYQACCPFHNEKTPSFTVSSDKQFYHCFGCGAHGNAISFLMEYERLTFVEAIEDLSNKLGIEVQRENDNFTSNKPHVSKEQIHSDLDLMDAITSFYEQQLLQHPNSQKIINYLEGRGLSKQVIKQFRIGYAPPEWDTVLKRFGRTAAAREQLNALKLTVKQDTGREYDFFRDRIMFPIRNKRGKVIAFGGRVLGDGNPKYLNSPETRLFHKSFELYGLYEAREHKQLPKLVVVEGYMDVVALAQHDISYAVASLGTSTTTEQVQSMLRASKEIVCCYDGDRAGRDAAWRALENALPQLKDGCAVRFVFLPDGEDPDSQVRKEGKAAFESRLTDSTEITEFFFERLLQNIDATTDAGKTQLVGTAKPLIEKVPSDFYRDIFLHKLATIVGRDPEYLAQYINKPQMSPLAAQQKMKVTPMRRAIALLLQHPELAEQIPSNPAYKAIDLPGFPLLMELHQLIKNLSESAKHVTTALILENFREKKEFTILAKLAVWQHGIESENLEKDFLDTFNFLEDQYLKHRLEQLLLKEKTSSLTKEERAEHWALIQALNTQ